MFGYISVNFNSHAHVERDQETVLDVLMQSISTHTLTWSVTSALPVSHLQGVFQLTRSRGA